ncbi:MAG: Tn3 family transposase, partial [Gammaproteobacteria bacterium]
MLAIRDRPTGSAAGLGGVRGGDTGNAPRSLRNGAAHIDQSNAFRDPDKLYIPLKTWEKQRARHYLALQLSHSPRVFLKRIRAALKNGLEQLDEAVESGALRIEDDRVRLAAPAERTHPTGLAALKRRLIRDIGQTQLPEVLLEVDSCTRFSWQLLGRAPRHERELTTVYAALLALGSDLSAADIVRMIPALSEEIVEPMIHKLEHDAVLRSANETVVDFLRDHSITELWGPGVSASADMMSLEATRHLWLSRLDTRRRTFAVGTYTHVLDQWGIIYDKPIVLNKRQAGAALEGALSQRQIELARIAVDTHGFTHAAMALAKLVGFDLCPRLARLADRKLYVPRDIKVPTSLKGIVDHNVTWQPLIRQWDPLVRIAASMASGWCSATLTLDRFGAAAHGNPIYEAAVALGKILRTIYLSDYLAGPAFRAEILSLLNQGESLHTLQRALYHG